MRQNPNRYTSLTNSTSRAFRAGGEVLLAAALILISAVAAAQTPGAGKRGAPQYPTREIRFIVPFPPGAGNDLVGRTVARALQESLGREVVVENRGAGGGTIGTGLVAKAAPDGYTMLINNISLAINATLFEKLPYDTRKDLAPVSLVARQPSVLLVAPKLEAKSVRELLELARRRPGQIVYGSGGPGTSSHLATERLLLATGTRMTHVPYKGLAQAVSDLASDRVELVIATASTALPLLAGGKVRALAVTTARRSALFPQLPTLMEAGVPGYEVSTWYALLVPAKTPEPVIARLNSELAKIAANVSVKGKLAAEGVDTAHTSPGEARSYLRSEIEKWSKVVKASEIKLQ